MSPPGCRRRVTSLSELQGGDGAWGFSIADQTMAQGAGQWGRERGLQVGTGAQLSPQLPGDLCTFIFALGSKFLASELQRGWAVWCL